jgi:hypothetical protein
MPPLPKYLKRNADELRRIRQNQRQVSFEEALRQVKRVARREEDSSVSDVHCYDGQESTAKHVTELDR